jgi:uncharacterized RDD family membrane protein YckC
MLFIKYMAALFYDAIIIFTLYLAFTTICLIFRHGAPIPPGTHWYQWALVGIVLGYYVLSYFWRGQTVGMRAWRLKAQRPI